MTTVAINNGRTLRARAIDNETIVQPVYAVPPKPVTPVPAVAPSPSIIAGVDVTITSTQTVYFNTGMGYVLTEPVVFHPASLYNAGTIVAIGANAIAVGNQDNGGPAGDSLVSNLASGVIMVEATSGYAYGFSSELLSSDVLNAGLMQVVSDNGYACGAGTSLAIYDFTNTETGTVTVWAKGAADGVYMYYGQFTNAGTINVTGADAIGVTGTIQFHNSGTITVTSTDANIASVGVDIDPNAWPVYYNSGTITADFAFYVDGSSSFSAFMPNVTINNSGTINGSIILNSGFHHIQNTGSITGTMYFGRSGNSVYDGASGRFSGRIELAHGNNLVTLGSGAATVIGGGGSDTVTGGAGDDVFDITRGTNVLDGKGGYNTLCLASTSIGYCVDLGLGKAAGAGVSTIRNIQQVIGSSFDDTLTAGSDAATLYGYTGSDTLVGGAGNDTLIAGAGGGDQITGGGGNDTFIYSMGDARLTINDFGAGDVLKIYGYTAALSVQQQGGDALITLSGSDRVLVKNVQASSLNAGNLLYTAAPYVVPVTLRSGPLFGTQAIDFTYDLIIFANEKITLSECGIALVNDGNLAPNGRHQSLDNYGSITILNSGGVIGMDWVWNAASGGAVTNEAGAIFSVTCYDGTAIGFHGGAYAEALVNAGRMTVNAYSDAFGVSSSGEAFGFTNRGGGDYSVTSTAASAIGLKLLNGGNIVNDGTFTITGAGSSTTYGLFIDRADVGPLIDGWKQSATRIINTGTMTVSGGAQTPTVGIALNGMNMGRVTVTNSGMITAETAIMTFDEGYLPAQSPSVTITNTGTIRGNIDLKMGTDSVINNGKIVGSISLGDGNDVFDGSLGQQTGKVDGGNGNDTLTGSAGANDLRGGGGDDVLYGGSEHDTLTGGSGNDTLEGGTNVDTAIFSGNKAAYTITQTSTGVFQVAGPDGTDILKTIEYAKFDDQTMRLLPGTGATINWSADPSTYMTGIRDFDGNDLGSTAGWKLIGTADVNGDGTAEHILVNRQNGRWAEISTEADGKTYFGNCGWAGDTRVVGIYIDPLVTAGIVQAGSDTDSQRRFQNDLNIENIHGILGQNDYNHDGLQEIYFSLTDGTAYLHAYMHADGNIQYANYQNEQQVKDYLTSNGFTATTWAGWFPLGQTTLAAVAA